MYKCKIEVSIGELIDKLSILKIKLKKIKDKKKLNFVRKEYKILKKKSKKFLKNRQVLNLYFELVEINKRLWNIEDELRILENEKRFDKSFIELARLVYITNDLRFNLKNQINELTNSSLKEQKSYKNK